ncbi:MAG: hypothetical protein H6907_06455 [Hyphomicrobiales bacterium]|nr:hypothetical protein [Hyphomicrobiales bacterium]
MTDLGTGILGRAVRRLDPIHGVMALALLVVAGCAAVTASGNQQIADKANENIAAVKECCDSQGVTEESARAKDPSQRTPAEHALLAALDAERKVAEALAKSNAAQRSLDSKLARQRAADATFDGAKDLLDLFRPKINFFTSGITELFSIADAISAVKEDPSEGAGYDWGSPTAPLGKGSRQVYEVMVIGTVALAPLGLGPLIGEALGTAHAVDRLREKEVRKVRELLSSMREMQALMRANGFEYDAGQLDDPIAQAELFLEREANGGDLEVREMLRGMSSALHTYKRVTDKLVDDQVAAQADLDKLQDETRAQFDKMQEAEAELNNQLARTRAALQACRNLPNVPGNIDWQRTWWLISSP